MFSPGSVRELKADTKIEAIRELIRKAPPFSHISDRKELERVVLQRESTGFTACGHGVAFSHGSTELVSGVTVVMGISRNGLDYDAPDGKPVHLLFIIASPPDSRLNYLVALSTLARICYDNHLLKDILEVASIEEIEHKLKVYVKQQLAFRRKTAVAG